MINHASRYLLLLWCAACTNNSTTNLNEAEPAWLLVDDFETGRLSERWTKIDAQNNAGSRDGPYGNGGVRYDDIYIAQGRILSTPAFRY